MDNKQYQERKARSNQMLQNGVIPIKDGFNEYWIPSQVEKNKRYKVTIKQGWYSCQCQDNLNGNLCKHILLLKTFFAITLKAKDATKQMQVSHPCPECNSHNLRKDGTRKTTMGKRQKWLCSDCGKRFVNEPLTNIKGNLDVVTIAMDLYMRGVSYRGIKDHLKQFFGLKINHVTIMRWIQTYMEKINQYTRQFHPQTGNNWHADEQLVNVKGKHKYVWNCMDGDTRFLLSNKVTQTRTTKDARELFQEAKQTAGMKAIKVTTDGAFAYQKAVEKEFRTYSNPKPHDRYVTLKQKSGNNNVIERYHGSFRQRDKSMRAFKSMEGVDKYAKGFKTFYNFVREHQTLKQTPAQKGGLTLPNNWKELLKTAVMQQTQSNS